MGYLYGVRIRQVEEIFINNREMLSYGKFMCTYRKKRKPKVVASQRCLIDKCLQCLSHGLV